jgi:hypothetical protein
MAAQLAATHRARAKHHLVTLFMRGNERRDVARVARTIGSEEDERVH